MVKFGVFKGQLRSLLSSRKGFFLLAGSVIISILSYLVYVRKSRVIFKTLGAPSCEQLWEQRRKSHEKYIDRLAQSEIQREENIASWNGKRAYDMYEPEWVCDTEKRVGPGDINIGDGPKFVCAPDSLKEEDNCLVYSIGCNYDFQFENGIRKHASNCEFHTFDGTMNLTNKPLPSDLAAKGIHFHNWNVDTTSGTSDNGLVKKSMEQIVLELGHIGRTIHVFKIDCEGCEYTVIPQFLEMVKNDRLQIEQIQVEMHGTDAAKIQVFFNSIRKAGYEIFHKERNHWGCNGYECIEYALIKSSVARRVFEDSYCLQSISQNC